MDDLIGGAGEAVVGIVVGCALFALAMRSPLMRWCVTVTILLAWFALGVLLPAGFAVVHLNRGSLALAAICVATVVAMGLLWRALGWPLLLRCWRVRLLYWKLWE